MGGCSGTEAGNAGDPRLNQQAVDFDENQYFYMSCKKWPNSYAYMTMTGLIWSTSEKPGEEGQFRLQKSGDGYWFMTTKKWPTYRIFFFESDKGSGISGTEMHDFNA